LLVAGRAGLARGLQLLTNRFLVAVVDRRQQLAGFDDKVLLCVEKAIDVAPGQVARPICLAFRDMKLARRM
jgi:hypothetical protein